MAIRVNNPTYRTLSDFLSRIPDERLDDHVTLYDPESDEFYPIQDIGISGGEMEWVEATGILDEGHVFLVKNS